MILWGRTRYKETKRRKLPNQESQYPSSCILHLSLANPRYFRRTTPQQTKAEKLPPTLHRSHPGLQLRLFHLLDFARNSMVKSWLHKITSNIPTDCNRARLTYCEPLVVPYSQLSKQHLFLWAWKYTYSYIFCLFPQHSHRRAHTDGRLALLEGILFV